jgi:hypothetical protein
MSFLRSLLRITRPFHQQNAKVKKYIYFNAVNVTEDYEKRWPQHTQRRRINKISLRRGKRRRKKSIMRICEKAIKPDPV